MKKIKLGLLAVLVLIVYIFLKWPDDKLHVVLCDVGQGDSILVTRGFAQVLIDGGPDEAVEACLQKHLPFWDKTLEWVVITHWDEDHIGGLPGIFDKYQVRQALISDLATTQSAEKLQQALREQSQAGLKLKEAILGRKIEFTPGGELLVLSPFQALATAINVQKRDPKQTVTEIILSDNFASQWSKVEDHNDRSIVLLLKFYEFEMLLMGDASTNVELALSKHQLLKEVEAVKIAHHGAKTSTGLPFLQTTRPEICMISCASGNQHGHPAPEVLTQIEQVGCQLVRTDQHGTSQLVTDGFAYWLVN